jgi:hypothetical protein
MSFTGNEDHSISLQDAVALTSRYQQRNPNAVKAEFFGRDAIKAILDQEGCVGIRIYYGLDENGKNHLVLVGADADENDLHEGVLAERAQQCPPICPTNNSPL